MITAVASLLFIVCQMVKALRLYFVLGEFRIRLSIIFILISLGVSCSYMMGGGKPLVFELTVALPAWLLLKLPLFPLCYSLIVLRLFDSLLILALIFILGFEITSEFVIFIGLFALGSWMLISSFPMLMSRVEKRILVSQFYSGLSVLILKLLVNFRHQIQLLSLSRRGSIPMIIMLTCMIWGLEISALGVLLGNYQDATDAVCSRVAGSLGMFPSLTFDYTVLIYVLLAITVLTTVSVLTVRAFKRHA